MINVIVGLGVLIGGFFLLKMNQKQNKENQKKIKNIINVELQDFFSNVWLNNQVPVSYEDIEDAEILEEELEELENSNSIQETTNEEDDFVSFEKSKKDLIH